jgi:DNA-binding MarR family transcriptional regulator
MSTDKNILIDVWLISLLANRIVSEILEDIALSVDEFAMYGLISDLQPITAADLVRATGLSPTTVSGMVRRCEARGELVRHENPADARSALLDLTPSGYRLLGDAVPLLVEAIEAIKKGLGGEHDPVRGSLRDLDRVLRHLLDLGPRPYELDSDETGNPAITYPGTPLSSEQTYEVRQYIDWIRIRDS